MERPIVALMQPTFLPWQGYFALLDQVDLFVFLDDFQFSRQSFQQRNRLFVSGATDGWVTLPVQHASSKSMPIADMTLDRTEPRLDELFRKKFLGLLQANYGPSPHFAAVMSIIRPWIQAEHRSLADLNISFVEAVADLMGIRTPSARSSSYGVAGWRSERIADLLRSLGTGTYLAAFGAFDYMAADGVFPLSDIDVRFQNFQPAPYPQRQSRIFVPKLSVLDLLFQVGAEQAITWLRTGSGTALDWDMRKSLRQAGES